MSEPQRLTRWQYTEVRALCRQYDELRSKASMLLGPRGVSYDPQIHGGGGHGDPTAAAADKRERILQTVHLIDHVAMQVDHGRWAGALVLNACYGVPYEKLPPESMPTSHRWDFFRARRTFYWILWEARHGITDETWNDFT